MTTFPWTVAADELFSLRGSGGQRFADFVSAVLRAEGAASGVKADDIQTNTRVNLPDGGVDAEVKVALGGPLALTVPTCWQFKATAFTAVGPASLTEEANKPEAKRMIEDGHAYYVCVCDDAPPDKMAALDLALLGIVRAINSNAPAPRVLNVGHLADWASRHSAVVLQFFRGHLGQALSYEPWLRKEREPLSIFVELPARAEATEAIRAHVSANQVSRPVMSVFGPTGAGVSRLVAEALAAVAPRVIYVPDGTTAVVLATSLVNQPNASGVLVVDRCSASARAAVEDIVKAEGSRLRVVAIHDATEQASSATLKVEPLEGSDVQKVVDANFATIQSSHRRAFVHFADGILKIAARLALSYSNDPAQFLLNEGAWADDELRRLVRDAADHDTLRALALFSRVGFAGDVGPQLVEVCGVFRLDAKDVVRRAKRLSTAPGVVGVGERYLSVRPRLFARPLFEAAWDEAVGEDVGSFMDRISPDLTRALLKQAAVHASERVRDAIADWAMPKVAALTSADLGSSQVLDLLLPLVEIAPTRMGPALADLVVKASEAEASAVGERFDHWPARMHVIWKLRQLMERRETYSLAESALFRLARAEADAEGAARQSSTATESWSTSFRVYLSGTEVPLRERLVGLASKLDAIGSSAIPLVVVALGFTVSSHAWKMEGSPVVHGDLRRPDWQPSTYAEYWDGLNGAIALLARCAADRDHGARAVDALVKHGRGLLQSGRVKELREAFDRMTLDDLQRVAVRGFVADFLAYDADHKEDGEVAYPAEYIGAVSDWHSSLSRTDLAGRVFEALSPSHRRQLSETAAWTDELNALGVELCRAPDVLMDIIPALVGGKHHGGGLFALGRSLGQTDVAGGLLSKMMAVASGSKNPLLHRGYIGGLAEQGTAHDAEVQAEIDKLEAVAPELAVDLNGMNGRISSAGARAIRLVRSGRLPGESLTGVSSIRFHGELLGQAIEAILDTMKERPEDAAAAALDILGSLAWDEKATLPEDPRVVETIWRAIETARDGARGEAHTWARLLRRLSEVDFERAVRVACTVAVKGDFSMQDEAACELSVYIGKEPGIVLSVLGPMLLEPSALWTFGGGRRGTVLISFPVDVLIQWIVQNGVDAARLVASHMPSPHLDGAGAPVVPPLTAFVLEKFESDDRVFSTFCSSRHNLQMYSGDIAALHEEEAKLAEKFRTHVLRRVREWAEQEVRWGRQDAKYWRQHNEEDFDE